MPAKHKLIMLKLLQINFHHIPVPIIVLGIVMLSFAIRFAVWYSEPVISRDGISYIQLAEALQLAEGNFDQLAQMQGEYKQSPLFITILASNILGASPHIIALTLNLFCGSLFPILIYIIFIQLLEKPAIALLGALFAAVHPTLVNYSIEVQREMGYLFFAGCFFYCLIGILKRKDWYWSGGAGAAAITAFFFRYEGAELFCFAAIVYLTMCFAKDVLWKKLFLHLAFFAFCTILTVMIILAASQKSSIDWWKNSCNKISSYLKV